MITVIHSDINVKALPLGNGNEFEQKLFTFYAPNVFHSNPLNYGARPLNHHVTLPEI
jgi:hypothetical protein